MRLPTRRSSPRSYPRRAPLAAVCALLVGAFLAAPAPAQEFEEELHQARERLERARQAHLNLVAPRAFQRAAERLRDAEERYARGDRVENVRRSLGQARDALAEAERWRESGTRALEPALRARTDALQADAPRLAPDAWVEAERQALDAGRRVERGDLNDATRRAREAEALYRDAELRAIRTEVLGQARELHAAARQADARRYASVTLAEGEEALREADRVLEGDRTRLSRARELGEAAALAFRRAMRMSAASDSVRRNRLSVEELFRRHEEQAARLAEPLRFEPDLDGGVATMAEQALAAIRGLQEDRQNLQSELAEAEAELTAARSRVDSLEAQLAGAEEREAEIAAELRERERRERKLREVRAIFTEEEGEVLVSGDRLILRLHGFVFPTGRAEVAPDHHSLLTKVQRVLREFPEAPVTVQGHTDSQGNPEFNHALSQRRAIAVREYLLAAMPISSDRISAVGYGETRPIATNATAAGRERNRRIEVVLEVS